MIRSYFLCGLGLVLAVAVSFSVAQTPPKAVDKMESPAPEKTLRERMRENQKKLTASIDFAGVDDPTTTLGDVLKDLGKRYDIVIDVKDRAFEAEGLRDVLSTPLVSDGKPLPPLKAVSLDYVLRKIFSRIPVVSGATYINRGETIEITTGQFRYAEIYFDPDRQGPDLPAFIALPLVHRNVAKQPLEDALKEIAEHTLINIVLDARVGEKARAAVTADFADVPLDMAVGVLADMADLKSVLLANVLYVTTRDNAKVLQAEYRRRRNYDESLRDADVRAENDEQRAYFISAIREKRARELEADAITDTEKKARADLLRAEIRWLELQTEKWRTELDKIK
jgi:hypothetical protein